MRSIILLAAIALLSQCSSLTQLEGRPRENQGVIECMVTSNKDIANVTLFCGNYTSDNVECYKDYRAVELCLVNNQCQYPRDATAVPPPLYRYPLSAGTAGKIYHSPLPNSLNFKTKSPSAQAHS